MRTVIYDVEVFPNVILVTIEDFDTKEQTIWEISEYVNNLKQIREFFRYYDEYLVSINGIHYDNCIILFLLKSKFESRLDCLKKTKEFSDLIVNNEWWYQDKPEFKWHNQWIDIDLFLYFPKSLRLSKKISLKGLAIQLNYPVIQELPFPINKHLTYEEIEVLKIYNAKHDIGITRLLYNTMYKENKFVDLQPCATVEIRKFICKEYGIKAMSMDIPKIASEVLFLGYCEKTEQEPKELRSYFRQLIKNRVKGFVKY